MESILYFNCVIVFKTLCCRASVRGGAHVHFCSGGGAHVHFCSGGGAHVHFCSGGGAHVHFIDVRMHVCGTVGPVLIARI